MYQKHQQEDDTDYQAPNDGKSIDKIVNKNQDNYQSSKEDSDSPEHIEPILVTITSLTVSNKFFWRERTYGFEQAVRWLVENKDEDYPHGFVNSEFKEDGKSYVEGFNWLNNVRATNLSLTNQVVKIDREGRDISGGIKFKFLRTLEPTEDKARWEYREIHPPKKKKEEIIVKTPDGTSYKLSLKIEGNLKGKVNVLIAVGPDDWAKVYTGFQIDANGKFYFDSSEGWDGSGYLGLSYIAGVDLALNTQEFKYPLKETGNSGANYTNKTNVNKLRNMGEESTKMGKKKPVNRIPKITVPMKLKVMGKNKTSFSVGVSLKSTLLELNGPIPATGGVVRIEVNASGEGGIIVSGILERIVTGTPIKP